jgi:hypothetical protein
MGHILHRNATMRAEGRSPPQPQSYNCRQVEETSNFPRNSFTASPCHVRKVLPVSGRANQGD